MIYLKEHINKYPNMQIEDKIKLIYQGTLGPNHLNINKEKLLNNLVYEYNLAKINDINYEMIEEISDLYVRIYIKPYFDFYKSFDKLIDAFILSCNEQIDENQLKINLDHYINEENANIVATFQNKGYIHHSNIYKELYKPYYLVISKKYINIIKGEEYEI